MDKIVALCKRRGFIYPGSEIYGGITGFWDYGPLGVELKNNIKREWWKSIVYDRDDVVGIDAAIIMNPEVWKASGHLDAFTDPLVECKTCHHRFRIDHLPGVSREEKYYKFDQYPFPCPTGGHEINLGMLNKLPKEIKSIEPRHFNLLVEAKIGVVEGEKKTAYLRGEITQGAFVNFENIVNSSRVKIPFGIAQIGKAFRNEITPGNFTFRSREFEQMELEFLVKPDDRESNKWFEYWRKERMRWYLDLGMKKENLRFRIHEESERAHYARSAEDIEYNAPFGWSEFEGIHHRGDWDLSRHNLKYKDERAKEEFTPWVIETSGGVDRSTLFFLVDSYYEDEKRVVLKLHPKLAPVKVAVFPLLANKLPLVKMAKDIYHNLKEQINGMIAFDDRGNIGKRYYSQDEIGTPFCVTIDFQSIEDKTVTIRDRDTMKQERLEISKLQEYLKKKLS
ncbi:MAG: glycine--tRNA ligase [Candidatus Levybacteria bacterium]|nr:glycine--tRNA ligase [Candidatus Levybacteria bacterium]